MSNVLIFWCLAAVLAIWWTLWLKRILVRHWWSVREARRYRERAMRRAMSRYVLSQLKSPPRLSSVATLNRCVDPPTGSDGHNQ